MKKLITTVLIIASLSACQKEGFKNQSDWLTPLMHSKLSLENLITDSTLTTAGNGSATLVFNEDIVLASVADIVEIPDRLEEVEVTLSSLELEDRSFTDTITLAEMYPQSVFLNGQTTTLAAQDITSNQGIELDLTKEFFTTATFVDGYIDIKIHNDLPVEAELIEFSLLNSDDRSVVIAGNIQNLSPNDSVEKTFSLAGKTVDGLLELNVSRIKTKASGIPVLIEADKGLRTTFFVRDLQPQKATAVFPEQDLVDQEDEHEYDFNGAELSRVVLKRGLLFVRVESTLEETIELDYAIPNSSKAGQAGHIEKRFTIPAAEPGKTSVHEETFSIDGFDILLGGKDLNNPPLYNHIYTTLKARIKYSGIERTLSLSDRVKIEFGLIDIVPELILGDPGYHEISASESMTIDRLNRMEGGLSLEDAIMDIELENSFGIDVALDIVSITGMNNRTGSNVALSAPSLTNRITLDGAADMNNVIPSRWSTTLNKSNSNIKPFLENLPDEIQPQLLAIVRPNGTINHSDFAVEKSELIARLKFEVPLKLKFDQLILETRDTVDLFERESIENIAKMKLNLLVMNTFPMDGTLRLDFYDEAGSLVSSLFGEGENKIDGAAVDPSTGKTTEAVYSELSTQVDPDEMEALKTATTVRIFTALNTNSTERQFLYDDYSLDLKLTAEITYDNEL